MSAELSTDSGASWTEIWGRQAGGLSSTLWDSAWQSASVSLADFAGQSVRIRFVLRANGSAVINATLNHGCFLDDIQVTNSTEISIGTITDVGTATSFTLDEKTAGTALVEGETFLLRVRPTLGCETFGWSEPLSVVVVAPSGYLAWSFASTVGGALDDYDSDGLVNGLEYALGLDPTEPTDSPNAQDILSVSLTSKEQLSLSVVEPEGVSGVTYGAESSTDLKIWSPLTDVGEGTTHRFETESGAPQMFVRWSVTVSE